MVVPVTDIGETRAGTTCFLWGTGDCVQEGSKTQGQSTANSMLNLLSL